VVGIGMPDQERLPPGPRRDLVAALHELYEFAGRPATRRLSAAIRDRDDLPGTLSHEGVSAVLRGVGGCPRWHNLVSLVRVLVDGAVSKRDVEVEVLRIHALWCLANGGVWPATLAPSGQERLIAASAPAPASEQDNRPTDEDTVQANKASEKPTEHTSHPGATWNHPRYGRFDFFDKQMVPEVIREVGKLDE
jgi:hypothetical protein